MEHHHMQKNVWNIIYKQVIIQTNTSYTNKCMEYHIQTNAWNIIYKQIHEHHIYKQIEIIYKQMYGTSYTMKYKQYTNKWNIYKQMHIIYKQIHGTYAKKIIIYKQIHEIHRKPFTYTEHHIQTNVWNFIYKQIHGTT